MRLLVTTTALLICFASHASASFQFTMSGLTVNTNVAKSTLAVTTSNVPSRPTIFALTNVGDSVTLDLFSLSASGTGTGQVAVDFQFSQPVLTPGGGGKGSGFIGTISNGFVNWNNPTDLNFGPNSDGILQISLSNGPIDQGPIQGTFMLKAQPSAGAASGSVPEPCTLAIWSLLGMVGLIVSARPR